MVPLPTPARIWKGVNLLKGGNHRADRFRRGAHRDAGHQSAGKAHHLSGLATDVSPI